MKRVFRIVVALALVAVLGLASGAPVAAVQAPITVEVTNPIAWELSDYIIEFRNAAALVGPADHIDIMFPTDTGLGTVTSVTVTTPATMTTYTVIGSTTRIRLAAGEAIALGADVAIVVANVTNPGPGMYILCVGTSTASPVCSDEDEPEVVETHEVTMAADPVAGGVATDETGAGPYEAGVTVAIKAVAASGYRFVNWTAAPEVEFDDAGAAETTFVMPDEPVTITAGFEAIGTAAVTMAADPAEGGVATDETGTGPYEAGATVAIKAVAASGYRFVNWTAAPEVVFDDAGAAETTFVMPDEAVTITAGFVAIGTAAVTMAADPAEGGVATDETGTGPYETGATVAIKAVAASGYRFVNWTAAPEVVFDDAGAAETTFVMPDEPVTITAGFVAVRELTISSTTGGRVTAPGEGVFTYDAGEVVVLTAAADDGYEFVSWTGDVDAIADADAASTTIIVDGDYSLTASFEEMPPVTTGCFIATAAYGTPNAGEIDVLREFRDVVLLGSEAGSRFVAWYYRTSPPIAEFLAGNELLRTFTRELLVNPVVWIVEATATVWRCTSA